MHGQIVIYLYKHIDVQFAKPWWKNRHSDKGKRAIIYKGKTILQSECTSYIAYWKV